jgi:hypothetical protein
MCFKGSDQIGSFGSPGKYTNEKSPEALIDKEFQGF